MARALSFWTDSGGGGKSTMTMNVADAIEQAGHRVIVWDIDQQKSSLTDYVGFTEYLADSKNNALEAVFDDDKSLNDVILHKDEHEGLPFDLIPGTLQWENFDKVLARENVANEWMVFRSAIADAGLPQKYDVIIIDAEGRRGLKEKNAIVATQNVAIPIFPNRKGRDDVSSGKDYIYNRIQKALADVEVEMDFGLVAVIPNKMKHGKNAHTKTLRMLEGRDDVPLTPFQFYNRGPYDDASDQQMTLRQFAESDEARDLYDYEWEILEKYEKLAQILLAGNVNVVKEGEVVA